MANQRTNINQESLLYDMFDDNEKAVADILLQLPRLMLDQNLTREFLPWGSRRKRSAISVPSSSPLPCNVVKKPIPKKEEPIQNKAEPLVPEAIPCFSPETQTKIKFVLPKRKLPPSLTHHENLNTLQIEAKPQSPEAIPPLTNGVLGVKAFKPEKKASQEIVMENLEKGLTELTENKDRLPERPITMKDESPCPKAAPSCFSSDALDTEPLKPKRKMTMEELENEVAKLTNNNNNLIMSIDRVKEYFKEQKAINRKLKALKQQLRQNKAKSDLGGNRVIGPQVKEPAVQLSHQQIPITPNQSPFVLNQMAYEPETFGTRQFPYGRTPPILGFNNDMSMREGLGPLGHTNISLSSHRTLGKSFIDQIKKTNLTRQ